MSLSNNEEKDEYYYFSKRSLDKIYVSKEFPFKTFSGSIEKKKRFIKKVFEKSEDTEFVNVDGEIVLRSSSTGRDQVSVVLVSDEEGKYMSFTLQKFRNNKVSGLKPVEHSFTFHRSEFMGLLKFLSDLKFIDFEDATRFVVNESDLSHEKILLGLKQPDKEGVIVNKEDAELIKSLSSLKGEGRRKLLTSLKNNILTKEDLDILSGRKEGLEIFNKELFKEKQDWDEKKWQAFFLNNSWIFGYGLDYRFLRLIQKEASISDIDVDGKNTVISDFLMGDTRFTVLVELKRPDTKLFERDSNRSKSWKLSKDLTYAVSQILTQKAEWEIKAQTEQYKEDGSLIEEKTYDPKTILIIGSTGQFKGTDRESRIKAKTFELYRRNSKNIEIITYDELYEKACFIVSNQVNTEVEQEIDDDLPF